MSEQQQKHRLYGRAAGKPLSKRQQALVDDFLPTIGVPASEPGALKLKELFPDSREVWLEIGFGGGEHLAGQAERHADVGFIGAEPFVDGVAKLLTAVDERKLTNVKVRRGDARDLVATFADASVDRAFILFPDPWPKTRHRKRRLVQAEFVKELAR
ncbi:MAG: tRNA (guanosine(46)-N7)-methyltransferase TrmB, partial [Alphaproteobacteria bacterium]